MKQLNLYYIGGGSGSVPDGKKVTPTDDIQIWLKCAGLGDVTYTTIEQVLADTGALYVLLSNHNAVDYMVRSITWASSIASDSTAMSYIGNNNYCADTLLGNNGVNTFVKYPYSDTTKTDNGVTFTDNGDGSITANGTASADTIFGLIGYSSGNIKQYFNKPGKYILDPGTTDFNSNFSAFFGIDYNNSWLINHWFNDNKRYELTITEEMLNNPSEYTVQYYVYVRSGNTVSNKTVWPLPVWTYAICKSSYNESVLNTKVPQMTSDTAPSGECFASSVEGGYKAYYAFDRNNSSKWHATGETNESVGYHFTDTIKVYRGYVRSVKEGSPTAVTRMKNYKIQSSTDGVTYTTLYTGVYPSDITDQAFIVTSAAAGSYCRVLVEDNYGGWIRVAEVQFYGRKDV